jgi:hypothetical protein
MHSTVAPITSQYSVPRPLSTLYYQTGFIYSTDFTQRLVAIPKDLRVSRWIAYDSHIILGLISGHVVIMDCHRLLRS